MAPVLRRLNIMAPVLRRLNIPVPLFRHSGRDPESPPDILWLILNGDANPERLPAETDTPIVHTQKNKYD